MNPIPTIIELNSEIANDLRSKLGLSDDALKKVLNALNAVLSVQFKVLNLYLADVQNNLFPDTADLQINGGTLERLGQIYLGRNPNPATVGVYELGISGEIGSVLRSGLTFKSNDNTLSPGQSFILDAEYTIVPGVNVIEVRALGNGIDYALDLTDSLTITEPVIGVEQDAVVVTILTQPTASETIENYRQAILDAIQLEPQGGAKTDYRLWSADAAGVRRVYPYVRSNNAGVVDIYVEASELDSTDGLGTPTPALLADVLQVIEFDPDTTKPINERGRRPIQAIIETSAITLVPVDVEIIGLNENTAAIALAINNNISAYLKDVRPFISGADLLRNKNDVLYDARLQAVVTDVLEASNFYQNFVMQIDGVTETSTQFSLGNIPYLRNLIFS